MFSSKKGEENRHAIPHQRQEQTQREETGSIYETYKTTEPNLKMILTTIMQRSQVTISTAVFKMLNIKPKDWATFQY